MFEDITTAVIIFIATGIIGTLGGIIIGLHGKVRALFEINKAQGRKEIVDAYDFYCVQNHKMTVERYDELHRTYNAYRKLGGNGTANTLWNKIETQCNPYIVH